jgi:hypothetical protein
VRRKYVDVQLKCGTNKNYSTVFYIQVYNTRNIKYTHGTCSLYSLSGVSLKQSATVSCILTLARYQFSKCSSISIICDTIFFPCPEFVERVHNHFGFKSITQSGNCQFCFIFSTFSSLSPPLLYLLLLLFFIFFLSSSVSPPPPPVYTYFPHPCSGTRFPLLFVTEMTVILIVSTPADMSHLQRRMTPETIFCTHFDNQMNRHHCHCDIQHQY